MVQVPGVRLWGDRQDCNPILIATFLFPSKAVTINRDFPHCEGGRILSKDCPPRNVGTCVTENEESAGDSESASARLFEGNLAYLSCERKRAGS
jgi:hypothetical protein